jgi:hypothetical protein
VINLLKMARCLFSQATPMLRAGQIAPRTVPTQNTRAGFHPAIPGALKPETGHTREASPVRDVTGFQVTPEAGTISFQEIKDYLTI